MARNRKRANRRPTRPQPPAGPRPGGARTRENGRAEIDPQSPELDANDAVEADSPGDAVEPAGPEASGAEGSADEGSADEGSADDSGLTPIDFDATHIPPIDFGLDTGRTAESEIEAGSERDESADGDDSDELRDADGFDEDDEDVEEFLDEHPEDAAETDDYRDADDVAADADSDYDEDGLDDDTGVAVAPRPAAAKPVPAGPRRRPRNKERKPDSSEPSTEVGEHRASAPVRLVHFVQGSWRELQRVQWPDRRQVMQATGVVVGFVIVAGAFLGVADFLSTKLINFILK